MIFTNPANQDAKSSANLLVLKYGTEHVLIGMPDAYDAIVGTAKQEFSIAEDEQIQLFTEDVFSGRERTAVRITAGAWQGLMPLLATVEVKRVQPARDATGMQTPGPSAGPSQSTAAESQKAKIPSPPEEEPTSRARPSASRSAQSTGKTPASKSSAKAASLRLSVQPSSSPLKKATKQPAKQEPTLPHLDEEEEHDPAPRSPMKKNAKRRVIDSDGERDGGDTGSAKRRRTSDRRADSEAQVKEELQVKPQPAMARSEALKATVARASPLRTPKREPLQQVPSTPSRAAQPQLNAGPEPYNPDASFVISVALATADGADNDEDNESGSQFKTKNKHTVRKVLWTACRTFGMQEQYEKVGLYMRDDEGCDHFCLEDKTVGELGITADTYLSVRYVDEED
ncbi:uncharacterized protein PHACADRAFT_198109 [Phanerochaete carnosa HHB-10118-sp]|uniref:Uncharacterized protein n=1 Tax=Phanerochaete carnosa (strain HHB-10118-sp) TaxID=650164 RepID=K5W414_PHACS|nr:uncharacterized protein PHACADRAFT_198109 [Phanerochaete carnosa HHB-10118-sp]EKM53684.1 hypothetical protein PHACADRAFT_198109 [Phanerochaete carnosa HHB-10118-sp]